jgi:hypothetical protein
MAARADDGNRLARLAVPASRSAHRRRDRRRAVARHGYGTFPEVFRNTARSAIAAAGSNVTMKRGPVSSDTITMSLDQLCPAAEARP